jgi:DNA-directed RNA polymerase specialized sigma subunit
MSAEGAADGNLASIVAQVESRPALTSAQLGPMLAHARAEPHGRAFNTVVEHHLARALAGATARRGQGLDVVDLFQEGSVAVVVALEEYVARDDDDADLGAFIDRVVGLHLDAAIERERADVAAERQLVADAEALQTARVTARRELGRAPTELELGGVLQWPPERVAVALASLERAESAHDAEILSYLDDVDGDG